MGFEHFHHHTIYHSDETAQILLFLILTILTVYDDLQIPLLCVTIPCICDHATVHSLMYTLYVRDRQYPVTGPYCIIVFLPLNIARWVTVCCTGYYYIGRINIDNRAGGIDVQTRGTICNRNTLYFLLLILLLVQ